jgi:hypothetical protein
MADENKPEGRPPEFDQDLADTCVGKYILVGITYLDHHGALLNQIQIHGIVESADRSGLRIALKGTRDGELLDLPPALEAISMAGPGTYTLRETGEAIENPDLLASWTVTAPPPP